MQFNDSWGHDVADLLRSTSFLLEPSSFGVVHAHRVTPAFETAWRTFRQTAAISGSKSLPFESLKNALRLVSGGLVRMWDGPSDKEPFFIVSQLPIRLDDIQLAVRSWQRVHFPKTGHQLADALIGTVCEQVNVADHLGLAAGVSMRPERWVWDAARWAALRSFISRALVIEDGPAVEFGFDTEGDAISWDHPIRAQHKERTVESLHKVSLQLITIPGIPRPIIHASSSLSAIANDPKYSRFRKAWIARGKGRPLLLADLWYRHEDETTSWNDRLVEIAKTLEVRPIPPPFGNPDVRVRCMTQPRWFPIGKGVGQRFHDAVARHCREVFADAEPLAFRKAVRQLPAPVDGAPTKEQLAATAVEMPETASVLALVCSSEMRERVRKSSKDFLGSVRARVLEVDVAQLPEAHAHLALPCAPAKVAAWAEEHVRPRLGSVKGCLVETVPSAERKGRAMDPKFAMRAWLASQGVGSQFISADSVPRKSGAEDHAAHRAWWDLLRTMGIFLRPFPATSSVAVGTPIIGLELIDPNRREFRGLGYQLALVAVRAGTREASGFVPGVGWTPLGRATPRFHASRESIEEESDVRRTAETALKQVLASIDGPAILFVSAESSRRIWGGLSDVELVRGGLPCEGDDRLAIVRVRSDEGEVPRPAGVGDWEEEDHRLRPGTMNALVRPEPSPFTPGAFFYASTSAVMGQNGQHRSRTRFTADLEELRNDWHSLTLTEFVVLRPGVFAETQLAELGAMLCRQAPTWDGTLDRPSPIHLAHRLIEDHPGVIPSFVAAGAAA